MSKGTKLPFPHNLPASLDLQRPLFSVVSDDWWADPPPNVTNKLINMKLLACGMQMITSI